MHSFLKNYAWVHRIIPLSMESMESMEYSGAATSTISLLLLSPLEYASIRLTMLTIQFKNVLELFETPLIPSISSGEP